MQLRILQVGDPRLRQKSVPIAAATPALQELACDMVQTMRAHDGVGLAAPQVGVNQRIVVIEVPKHMGAEDPDWTKTQLLILLNPEVVELADFEEMREGCLSLPGYIAYIERARNITAHADTLDGHSITIEAGGLLAQAIQHEVEHLDGVLIQDHVGGIRNLTRIPPPWVALPDDPEPSPRRSDSEDDDAKESAKD